MDTPGTPGKASAMPPVPEGLKNIPFENLPRSVQWVLGRTPPADYRLVESLMCRLPSSRDLVQAVQFTDTIFALAQRAMNRTVDRITGAEMDAYWDRVHAAAREIVAAVVELAARAKLTEVPQRYRRLLRRFGCADQSIDRNESQRRPAEKPASIAKVA